LPLLKQMTERALDRVLALRRRIATTPVLSLKDAEDKTRWLHEAEAKMDLIRLVADLLVAGELAADPKERKRLHNDWHYRLSVNLAAFEDIHAGRFTAQGEQPGRAAFEALRTEADMLLRDPQGTPRRPFHWPLEFPEVFIEEAGMSGVSPDGDRVSGIGYRPTYPRHPTYPTYPMQPPASRRWWATRPSREASASPGRSAQPTAIIW
jgi:hypothetical protein